MIDPNNIVKSLQIDSLTADEQMQLLAGIEKSIKNSRVQRQEAVKTNVDVVMSLLKRIEQDIRSRYDEVGNRLETHFSSIADGKNGKDGKDGKPGRDGRDGPMGIRGQDGRDGKDGADGQDGVSVTDAKIDFDGSLIITLSTGREINVGEVVAADLAEKIRVTMSTNSTVTVQDEGTTITSGVRSINFTGTGVTATASGDSVTVNVTGGGGGGVTSVTGTAPIVSSGGTTPAISLAASYGDTLNPYASKTANFVLAAPNGSSGAPTFRAVVVADIPTLNQSTTGNAATATTATNVSGGLVSTSRINPRVSSTTTTSSITPDIASFDQYALTAQAAALTINAPTGTPVDGNKLIFRILDNGTSQTISWNATYTVIGTTLPTATTANKMTYVGCIYNAANTRWDVIAITTQA